MSRIRDLWGSKRGLGADEVAQRRREYGANQIVEVAGRPWWDLVRDTARDPMLWFLAGVGTLYALIGERVEAATLLAASVPLVAMDAVLHWRARASTEGLRSRLASEATVMRDGTRATIAATEIVPGDLVVVGPSDAFPADGIVVGGDELQADESTLTGEAHPVRKRPLATPPADGPEPAVEGEHWAFAGTRLLTGTAAVRVVFTGDETLYGDIVRSAVHGTHERTPLQTAIASLVTVLTAGAGAICLLLAGVRLWQGYGWVDAVVSALTLAVAILPEEFPVVFAFFLGVGVYRLAQCQALVRRAVSIENVGRTTVICTDKTGTITEGRLRVSHLVPAPDVDEPRLLAMAALASRPDSGDPLDAAILAAAAGAAHLETLATFPFTEARRRETVVVRTADGGIIAASKGASETILATTGLGAGEREAWNARTVALADDGHKVIACAWRTLERWKGDEPSTGYHLIGLIALEDPVREGVAEAVAACRIAGIHTIMVTGDHPGTARAVAREIGLGGDSPAVFSGDAMEEALERVAGGDGHRIDVVARALPRQKLALVRALRAAGEIVAVTGDGVNDVPALQAADIGIAMGERGTRSAREVAGIVLLDDNFRTIARAIGEGRALFGALQRSFEYLIMLHIPVVVSAALVPLVGWPLLYLPIHVVWFELVIHPTALLAFQDGREHAIVPGGPRRQTGFFTMGQWSVILGVGTLLAVLVVGGYARSLHEGGGVEHARAMALGTLVCASATITAMLSGLRTRAARLVTVATLAVSAVLMQTPALAGLLHLRPLHADDLGIAAAGSVVAALPLLLLPPR